MSNALEFDTTLFLYIYYFNYYVRKDSALMSKNTRYSCMRVKTLLNNGYLQKIEMKDATILRLTEKGLYKLQKNLNMKFPPELKEWVTTMGTTKRYPRRYRNYGTVVSMINWFVPDLPYELLEIAGELVMPEREIFLSRYAKPLILPGDNPSIKKIEYLAQQKSLQDSSKNISILSRELLLIDPDKTKNLSYARARGLLRINGDDYILYNIGRNCMSARITKEEKVTNFYYSCDATRNSPRPNALFIGTSYRPVLTYFSTYGQLHNQMKFGKNLTLYNRQYFVERSNQDAVAIRLLGIPGSIDQLKYSLIPSADIQRANNEALIDGIDENGNLEYLGLLFDVRRVDMLRDMKLLKWVSKTITIWCFPWQAPVYHEIFDGEAQIKMVELRDVTRIIPGITTFHH